MNECVKTGVVFRLDGDMTTIRVGDLKRRGGVWSITGIPHAPAMPAVYADKVDIVITSDFPFFERGPYFDLEDIQIVEYSPWFRTHIHTWYPELKELFP